MSKNTPTKLKDLRTPGYVLRRTNYGETDRILNLITPTGKYSVIARGARKEKSKLAGSIEMFTLTDFNLHFGRSDLGVVTGAKMQKFHHGIIKDFARLELATEIQKTISRTAEDLNTSDYFNILDQSLTALGEGENISLIKAWAFLNLQKTMGEELNFYRDNTGAKLLPEQIYRWEPYEKVFILDSNGNYSANEIKLLRLMVSNDLSVVRRIKLNDELLNSVLTLIS